MPKKARATKQSLIIFVVGGCNVVMKYAFACNCKEQGAWVHHVGSVGLLGQGGGYVVVSENISFYLFWVVFTPVNTADFPWEG